jgi:CheY-like chemotaxis protein
VSGEEEALLAPESTGERTRRKATVLIAEDEEEVRELASQFLSSAGYEVFAAKDGIEALAIAEGLRKPIHVLICDVVMPRMRGPELAQHLRLSRNKLKIVYMSGYLEYNRGNSEFLEEGFFLQKPFSREALVRKVDEVLGLKIAQPSRGQSIVVNNSKQPSVN